MKLGKIFICGIEYSVEERTLEECPQLFDCYGFTVHAQCLIVLRSGMPSHLFRNVLIHEVQHGIWEHAGLESLVASATSNIQEIFIQVYTPHLIAALGSMKKWRSH